MIAKKSSILAGFVLALALTHAHAAAVQLDELDLGAMTAGWGKAQKNLSITQKPLAIDGVRFERGVGTHAGVTSSSNWTGGRNYFPRKWVWMTTPAMTARPSDSL